MVEMVEMVETVEMVDALHHAEMGGQERERVHAVGCTVG